MGSPRTRICLNGVWEASEAADGGGSAPPSGGWRPVRVPEEFGDWSRESAWYRLSFEAPADFEGGRVLAEVGRVLFHGRLLMNGRVCGESWQPRLPLVADVTAHARFGGRNELHVHVHRLAEGYSNPGEPLRDEVARAALLDYHDAADMAAIMGDVWLRREPAVRVDDLHIMPSVRRGELAVRAWVTNGGERSEELVLECSARRAGRECLALPAVELSLDPGETREVRTSARWTGALWGPPPFGERALYHLISSLRRRTGDALDARFDRFGFRELWAEGGRLVLNGRPVFLMGTHISDFEMREAMSLLVPKLQSAGFLFVHPHADNRMESFYDVCDEMGMLVWDCAFCGGPIGSSLGKWRGRSAEALAAALPFLSETYRGWIRRNRNHPCVVMWSAGCNNESVNGELARVILEEDPTRPVTIYGVPGGPSEVKMFGFPGFPGEEADYSRGRAAIQSELDARGARRYPLWIGEYWSRSGRPQALEITREMGVAGGCSFDVGGWRGCLPPFHASFDVSWPSESGQGQRRRSLLLRGHKRTYPETRHVNWCDPSKPVFAGEWPEEPGFRAAAEAAGALPEAATERFPEVIVTVTRSGEALAGEHVFVLPEDGQGAGAEGVMTDPAGRAWFVLREPGRHRAVCRGAEASFTAAMQPLRIEPGYGYIQRVALEL